MKFQKVFRPENVAEELYNTDQLDWVVIVCAGIVNIRDEWLYLITICMNIL